MLVTLQGQRGKYSQSQGKKGEEVLWVISIWGVLVRFPDPDPDPVNRNTL